MKILLGCDVDPVLPAVLDRLPKADIWGCLDNLGDFIDQWCDELPAITWLIRSDESVRFSTGDFASGYTTRQPLWERLRKGGHELGWHMHLASFDPRRECFGFDRDPPWLDAAFRALSRHFAIRATRIGWDYGSNLIFQKLDALSIQVDFSALPGHIAWPWVGRDRLRVDWLRCPAQPYHPRWDDYQSRGSMDLLEIPVTQFPNTVAGVAKRLAWRVANCSFSLAGIGNKTKLFTEPYANLLRSETELWCFYFHPEDLLATVGRENFMRNLDLLRKLPDVEFVTASAAREFILNRRGNSTEN